MRVERRTRSRNRRAEKRPLLASNDSGSVVNIIFISNKKSSTRTLTLNTWVKVLLSVCFLGLPISIGFFLGMQLSGANSSSDNKANQKIDLALINSMKEELVRQQQQLQLGREDAQGKIEALTAKLAKLQSRLVRLDALGERLASMAKLTDGEFDFSREPAVGGPEGSGLVDIQDAELETLFMQLESQLDDRENKLSLLESMIVDKRLSRQHHIGGKPVATGWISSKYGYRRDPFNGRKDWHNGVDIAGREGSKVNAMAAGVVTRSEPRQGYGYMVELDHGDGMVSRYAHNKVNLVNVGQVIKKGETLGLMGSTGRSTGPHVHVEIFKHGRSVDPATYIRRTIR